MELMQHKGTIEKSLRLIYSEKTYNSYAIDIKQFENYTSKGFLNADAMDVIDFFNHLKTMGWQPTTINRKINALSSLYEKLSGFDMSVINRVKQAKKLTNLSIQVITDNKSTLSLSQLTDAVNRIKNQKNKLIIRALIKTGLRLSELINIKKVDAKNNPSGGVEIKIMGKGLKQRMIYLEGVFFNDLRAFFNTESEYLISTKTGNKYHLVDLSKSISNELKKATGYNLTAHSLRHFFATYKISTEKQDIKAVSQYLGHSSTKITLDMYVDTKLNPEQTTINI